MTSIRPRKIWPDAHGTPPHSTSASTSAARFPIELTIRRRLQPPIIARGRGSEGSASGGCFLEVLFELGIHAESAFLCELHFAVRVVEAAGLQIDDREIVVRLAQLRVGGHRRLPLLGRPFGVPAAKQGAA